MSQTFVRGNLSPIEPMPPGPPGLASDIGYRDSQLARLDEAMLAVAHMYYETFPEHVRRALDVMRTAWAVIDAERAHGEPPPRSLALEYDEHGQITYDSMRAHNWRERIEHGKIAAPFVRDMHDVLRRNRFSKPDADARVIRVVYDAVVVVLETTATSACDRADLVCATLALHVRPELVPPVDRVAVTFENPKKRAVAHAAAIATIMLGETSIDSVKKAIAK